MTSQSDILNSSGQTDEALAVLAQSGTADAADELLLKYRPLVQSIASRYSGASLENDDIVQEGLLGLLSAIYSYSAGKNAAFRTYCAVCIHNAIRSAIRKDTGLKNTPLNSYISIDDIEIAVDDSPENTVISQENAEVIRSVIDRKCSCLEKKILMLHINGVDYRSSAGKLDISEKAVDNALQRVRAKLSAALNGN